MVRAYSSVYDVLCVQALNGLVRRWLRTASAHTSVTLSSLTERAVVQPWLVCAVLCACHCVQHRSDHFPSSFTQAHPAN